MLVLGPVLRHVGETTAQIWVQTEGPATVRVLGCEARTFEVQGHHFALVGVTGLSPDSRTPYEVHVDGEQVWPLPNTPFPASLIRTRGAECDGTNRIIFGSCRYAKVADPKLSAKLGIDALDAYAARMVGRDPGEWPDALLLLGDQVYADELTPMNRRRIAGRRDRHPDWPDDEIVDFGEYVGLYRDSWSDPEIRWLLSTVPTAMIFDDHDIRDDWNTSKPWRDEMRATSWWRDRIRGGLASYWVFQHLGNLAPDELAADRDWARIRAAEGDAWPLLVELADRADAETDGAKGVRFSFRWDLGRSRFVMIDSRNGRILEDGQHLMLGDSEFDWIEGAVHAPGAVDHLVLGTSLPWLLPHAIGELQTVNEIAASRPGWRGKVGEAIRQGADLEHWAAFRESFDRLTAMIERAAGSGVASVNVLSGDVHHSYAARADLEAEPPAAVHQLTCSPVHNHVEWFVKPGFRLGWSRFTRRLTERWSERAGAPAKTVDWERLAGPLFGNTIATLDISGRHAEVFFEQPTSASALAERARLELTAPVAVEVAP
ncbi:alkaline phosphatase family protein [Pseudonocardia sp. KRD-184]|uniref:Alkaline phosphatase family protein n=1 Tax=Pseudonocardia oceani TaxID=2792013 RepID=A0ABS6UE77_9PSEU|nr:alkaline phosphatase D family protein [Pseudonocardia oceani]MBW0090775.1 alkaline phosphatase family protein [Pseudonocardia oceani]MBW0097629.1 alkaline phosphatase family protein [Pseudonocardia oceani]MBW0107658.1 alkaline phosphatase family protein [Pseudonocardia oceani]MBW0123167.1 alkaline phosphatase family protein [Pseudonocardia oceani]MBW0130535.1 alkaline phosphatase family protein [Pseudonocardia oceani]